MLMDEGLDTGPVLSQKRVPIEDEDTTGTLTERLAEEGAELLVGTIDRWLDGTLTAQPQDEDAVLYSGRITPHDGRLDWSLSAETLWRQVRAYHPWPGSHTSWRGRRLKVHRAVPLPVESSCPEGTIVRVVHSGSSWIGVQTGKGVLGLRTVQLEGKREVAVEDFVRGYRNFVGSSLESQL